MRNEAKNYAKGILVANMDSEGVLVGMRDVVVRVHHPSELPRCEVRVLEHVHTLFAFQNLEPTIQKLRQCMHREGVWVGVLDSPHFSENILKNIL